MPYRLSEIVTYRRTDKKIIKAKNLKRLAQFRGDVHKI